MSKRYTMAISIQVTFDCADPSRLASFWAAALGYKLQDPPEGYASWSEFLAALGIPEDQWNRASAIIDPDGHGPRIYFQQMPEPKTRFQRGQFYFTVWPGP